MDSPQRTYAVTALIPRGNVLTYKELAKLANVSNPRLVGSYLHKNPYPGIIPCHRVVNSQGKAAVTFAFGGKDNQLSLLKEEGIVIDADKIDLRQYLWKPKKVLKQYFNLLFKYGYPGPWPWFDSDKPHSKEEIVIGSILTQNTNWRNVQYSLKNLRDQKICSLSGIAEIGKKDIEKLKELIRPSGYYHQKGECLFKLSEYIIKEHRNLNSFFKLNLPKVREILLSFKGIGKETADAILLFSGEKPIFEIDAYTKRFVKKFDLYGEADYDELQNFFMKNLPKNVSLFQDYHALIIKWAKDL